MTCSGCAETVKNALRNIEGVESVDVDLAKSEATIRMHHHISLERLGQGLSKFPTYTISPATVDNGRDQARNLTPGFWNDPPIWTRAALNTLNCLIGCSIGDFGMILYLQKFHPQTSMSSQMILAVVAGLVTSIMLETVLLRQREKFAWKAALQTAFSMSFLSMIAMEVVMNSADFMITGGKAAFGNPMYWIALVISMAAGFLAPLPYNYYKLKKYNLACH